MNITRDEFDNYEWIKISGQYNMFTQAAQIMNKISISEEKYFYILENYNEIKNNYYTCKRCNNYLSLDDFEDSHDCAFCTSTVCDDCYDKDGGCFFPGDTWCNDCEDEISKCKDCDNHIKTIMDINQLPPCKEHPKYNFGR